MAELYDFSLPVVEDFLELLYSPSGGQVRGEQGIVGVAEELGVTADDSLQTIQGNGDSTVEQLHEARKSRRFASPKSEKEVLEARKASIPRKTQLDTDYCLRIWKEWRTNRNSIGQR